MSNLFFISDLHFHHKNITKYRPLFDSELHHRECIKDNWNSIVRRKDVIWVLGDSIFSEDGIEDINSLPGRKVLVMGNHCLEYANRKRLWECFEDVRSLYKKGGIWYSHAPIHSDELRGCYNVHGHTHNHDVNDYRYLNICVEKTNYKPIDINHIRNVFSEREKVEYINTMNNLAEDLL